MDVTIPDITTERSCAALERLDESSPDDAQAIREHIRSLVIGLEIAHLQGQVAALRLMAEDRVTPQETPPKKKAPTVAAVEANPSKEQN